jgi:hypothetical protein
MDGRLKTFLIAAVAVAFSVSAFSKSQLHDPSQKTSDLKVTVIPEKQVFVLHESVRTRIEFRNLGPKTYCFPKPSRDCTNDYPGSAVTIGRPAANNGDSEAGMPGFSPPHEPQDNWKLILFIRHLPQLTAEERVEMERYNPKSLRGHEKDYR